jgi:hypothetical protein
LWYGLSNFVARAGTLVFIEPAIRRQIALTARKRRIIRPAERHAGSNRLHWLEMDLAIALVVASVDAIAENSMRRMIGVITVLMMSQAAVTAEPQQIDLNVPSTTVVATVQINVKPS